jgi:septal ring factor EnvC (AmiA/AmiB activator)
MSAKNKIFVCFLLLFVSTWALAQQKSKEQLQKERQENLKKIEEASRTLAKTTSKKKASLGQLNALRYQIQVRQRVIKGLEEEMALLDGEINDNLEVIASLEGDLTDLKKEYGAMVYAAYKARSGQNKLTFLFSAKSFNQLLRRLEYLEQYSEARKKQVSQIIAVQDILREENNKVEAQKEEKANLLVEQKAENASLVSMRSQQQSVISDLQNREKELKRELANRQKAIKALDNLITDLIRKEAEAAARAAAMADKKASAVLSEDFSKNKQKLPWPADGFVSLKFGRSRDAVLKMVERNSPGIEIQTRPASVARSVFKGEVTAVALIQGFNKAVIVKHGDFYTVYAKLADVKVTKGQVINTGDELGTIFTDDDGISELHFELWQSRENGTNKLNPELWLTKK